MFKPLIACVSRTKCHLFYLTGKLSVRCTIGYVLTFINAHTLFLLCIWSTEIYSSLKKHLMFLIMFFYWYPYVYWMLKTIIHSFSLLWRLIWKNMSYSYNRRARSLFYSNIFSCQNILSLNCVCVCILFTVQETHDYVTLDVENMHLY